MIVVTATLLFVMLLFAPIYFKAEVYLYVENLSAKVSIGCGPLKVFREKFTISGAQLHCEGTVDTDLELLSIDGKSGINFLKCITVEKFFLSVRNNVARFDVKRALAENAVLAIATATACNLFHCQVCSECIGTTDESCICLNSLINVNVAELSFCLLKQGVRKWTRKSEK